VRAVPAVLITGTSRGIGRATALRLARNGWSVIATVRRPEDGAGIVAEARPGSVRTLELDVTDGDQLGRLAGDLPERLDAVVNNAGIVVPGPLEALAAEDLRRQLEVNVVGPAAVTRAVLPKLRASRGRVVFVSSLSGRMSTPMTGAYNASKFALEALADAWRVELKLWGIGVSLIEPAMTDTDMWRTAPTQQESAEAAMAPVLRELYARHLEGMRRSIPRLQRMAKPTERVAATIERALTDSRPRARYVVGADARAQAAITALMPQQLKDAVSALATGTPSAPWAAKLINRFQISAAGTGRENDGPG
jgi:NAD(P)-dependent dehydrogenase (short-subunit alcohol dehydrogenase family)